MDARKQIYLLLVCQGFYLGSVCQRWTFPERLTALLGSCVEIPCTYDPGERLGASSTVWYLYHRKDYPEILNTKDASSVMSDYRDRTSLVPGNNSCSLRIDPVRQTDADSYYPGIAEDRKTNAYEIQNSKSALKLMVTDQVAFELLVPNRMTEGNATIMYCAVIHTCGSSPPSLRWNKRGAVSHKSVELTEGSWREESELTYIPTYEDDGTLVQCNATFLHGQYTKSRQLIINYAPKNVTVTVIGTYEIKEGDDVTLKCNSISKDKIKYEWYKGKAKTKLMESEQTITVKSVTKDTDRYGCAAINHVGRGESGLIEIQVRYAATGVHITEKYDSKSIVLTCVFLSSRPYVTHYTWMKNGFIVPNEKKKTLILDNNEEHYGEYSCIAHNNAGNSSSKEINIENNKGYTVDLPLILGTVAGVFFLLFLILVVYIYLRHKKKSALPNSPIQGTVSTRIPYTDENQYENIQSNHQAHPPSMGSEPSLHMKVEENCVIYSNSEAINSVIQPSNEVEYSAIFHERHDQVRLSSSRASHAEVVEYASLKR